MLHLAHGIEDARVLVTVETRERRPLGLKRTAARGDEQRLGLDRLVVVGADAKQGLLRRPHDFEPIDDFVQVERWSERMNLLDQIVDQFLTGDDREAGNVIDRLLRI